MSEILSIPSEVGAKVEKWAKKLDISEETVMQFIMKYYAETKNWAKSTTFAIGDLQEQFGSVISNAPTMYSYILNDSGLIDIYELMRQKAIRMYEDPETQSSALENGMITIDKIPLDYRTKMFGKDNPNRGMPLTGSSYQRTILAVVSDDDKFDKVSICELVSTGDAAKNFGTVDIFNFYKFRGNRAKRNPNRINLGESTKFLKVNLNITSADLSNKFVSIPMANMADEYRLNFAGKKRTTYLSTIKGAVTYLKLEPNSGARMFILSDEESAEQMRCRISDNVPIAFQRGDNLVVFCRLYAGRNAVAANIQGYLVV